VLIWDSALLYTRADSEDKENRVSNTLFQRALGRSTPDAYNPFNGGCLSDLQNGDCTPTSASTIRDITVSVYRRNSTSLASWDAKVSRPDLLRCGRAASRRALKCAARRSKMIVIRASARHLSIQSRLHCQRVMGQSGTLDTEGARNVQSAFVEFAVPLVSPDMVFRWCRRSTATGGSPEIRRVRRRDQTEGCAVVAAGRLLLFRSAWSEGFRAPNRSAVRERAATVQRAD
jgi:hypothetical protein